MSLQWFAIGSDQAQVLLRHGHFLSDDQQWVAQQVTGDQVAFSIVEGHPPSMVTRWFTAIRAISLTATFMPCLATMIWLWLSGFQLDWPVAVAAIVAAMFLQMAVNLFNDVEDYLKLIDLPGSLGGSGVIQQGWLSASEMNKGAWSCLIIGCLLGLPALMKSPEIILLCGAAAVVGVIGYSGKPLRLKYRALGDLAVLLLCGPVLTYGMAAAAIGASADGLISLGLFFGFAATAILNANNINDIYTDSARGSITLAGKLGFILARHWQGLYYLFAALALVHLSLLEFGHVWMLLPVVALPLVVMQLSALYRSPSPDHESLAEIRFHAAKTHLLLGILLCLGMALGQFFG